MISVHIAINGTPILARSAVRREGLTQPFTYDCDDGTVIEHNYGDGAVVLAKKLLDTIKESKTRKTISMESVKSKESNSV
jgi:hypothetical protein